MQRTLINPGASRILYEKYHFSAATRVGNSIWVSGLVGIDAAFKPAIGMAAQARLIFTALETILAEAGASLGDVTELVTFHINLRADMAEFSSVKDEFFQRDYPSWTAVGTPELAVPDALVEVRVTAIAGSAIS